MSKLAIYTCMLTTQTHLTMGKEQCTFLGPPPGFQPVPGSTLKECAFGEVPEVEEKGKQCALKGLPGGIPGLVCVRQPFPGSSMAELA